MPLPFIAVLLGSTRPNRRAPDVAAWVLARAQSHADARFEALDLADFALPLLDEPLPPARGQKAQAHTRAWGEAVARFDGFIVVTPEYNHSMPASLKNALDFLHAEWRDKAVGFVSYGWEAGGVRAVEALRPVVGALGMADVGPSVALSLQADWTGEWQARELKPQPPQEAALDAVLERTALWAGAMRTVRAAQAARAA